MKNLYPKGKGKGKGKGRIHPSPAVAAGTASTRSEATAVLKLLPAAILALTAALGNDDKEVLAYMILRSMDGQAEAPERRRCTRSDGIHSPLFDCNCFDCYRSFWSRWNSSPDQELIDQVIEAFEDHLASDEREGPGGKVRRRDRRVGVPLEKGKKKKGKEKKNVKAETSDMIGSKKIGDGEGAAAAAAAAAYEEEKGGDQEPLEPAIVAAEATDEGAVEVAAAQPPPAGGERRRGWADVASFFNSRLWNLWNPGE